MSGTLPDPLDDVRGRLYNPVDLWVLVQMKPITLEVGLVIGPFFNREAAHRHAERLNTSVEVMNISTPIDCSLY